MTAAWCRCISQSRSLICPSCKKCFCNASKLFRNQFWRDAPDALCEARDAQRPTEDQIPPVLKKPLVLVVDDDAAIRLLTAELVTRFGYGCISASNGQSALRLANRYHPDLVLTDLLMPGIDGRELSRLLEEEEEIPTPSIVFMTSVYRGESYEGEAMDVYGAAAYLEKPVPMEALRSVLVRLLPSKEESQANLSPSSSEISLKDLPDFDDELMIVKD